ncbi:hypothetical protein [Enterobacter asburiae]|uniref:hypothetical protein n=1 Tax=Enterobacter asburiae TaxID=61645 RepID=UPI0021D29459|nr:hypothetical protein [Enterobacter asburiae]MCU6243781.1 hypothetical protein [Enterobacter asburiae]
MAKKIFTWSSSESQLYDKSYGSQKVQQGNFDKNVGSSFVMDAVDCGLMLYLDNNTGEIVWPVYTPSYREPATIEIMNGTLIVTSGSQYIGVDPLKNEYLPISLEISRNGNVEFNCKEQFTLDTDELSQLYLRDDATLSIKVEEGFAVFGGGELNALDNSELKIYVPHFDFKHFKNDASICFTVGCGNSSKCTSRVVFSSIENSSVLETENLPKGVFNFTTSGENNGRFIFEKAYGFAKANLPGRELFSVDRNVIPPADFESFFKVDNINKNNASAGFSVSYKGAL